LTLDRPRCATPPESAFDIDRTKHVVAIFEAAIALHDGVSLADTAAAAVEVSSVVEQLLAEAAAVAAVNGDDRCRCRSNVADIVVDFKLCMTVTAADATSAAAAVVVVDDDDDVDDATNTRRRHAALCKFAQ
jgi:hypothetical protein